MTYRDLQKASSTIRSSAVRKYLDAEIERRRCAWCGSGFVADDTDPHCGPCREQREANRAYNATRPPCPDDAPPCRACPACYDEERLARLAAFTMGAALAS